MEIIGQRRLWKDLHNDGKRDMMGEFGVDVAGEERDGHFDASPHFYP